MNIWWLSFADDDGFLGGCFIEAADMLDAVTKTHRLGINPGGEAMGAELPNGAWERVSGEVGAVLNRLYARHEVPGGPTRMPTTDENPKRKKTP